MSFMGCNNGVLSLNLSPATYFRDYSLIQGVYIFAELLEHYLNKLIYFWYLGWIHSRGGNFFGFVLSLLWSSCWKQVHLFMYNHVVIMAKAVYMSGLYTIYRF